MQSPSASRRVSSLIVSLLIDPPYVVKLADNQAWWDVQEFFADSQKLPSKFNFDVPNTGHLEGTAEKHLRAGTQLELPYWLASTLHQKDMIDLNMPRAYGDRVRNALVASSASVNLRNLGGGGGAFYAGGNKLLALIEDEPLVKVLDESFRSRLVEVMDQSQHTSADSGGEGAAYEFCQGLDSWEKQLFLIGETSAREFKTWAEVKAKKPSR